MYSSPACSRCHGPAGSVLISPSRMDKQAKIYIGTAGWSYKDWEGIVYPAQIKKSLHPVEYLARYLDVIEINTSFYGHIKPEWGKLWCRKSRAVNSEFLFTAKLNKAFTPVSYTHLRAHETRHDLVCRL